MSFELHVPEGWSQVKLSDLGEVNRGRSRHRPRDAAHLYGGPYPFVQTGDVKASKGRITQHSQTYSEDGLAQSRLWPKGTMCITIAANIAETGILTYPACFPDSVIGFIADESKCNVYFIEYVFRLLRKRIQAQATGSVQDNINLQTLERLLFPIPALEEQNRIAAVLGELDDKIHLNYEINQPLEEIAQAIFKSWFVDFDPVKAKMNGEQPEGMDAATASLFPEKLVDTEVGELPEGWKLVPVGELLDKSIGGDWGKEEPDEKHTEEVRIVRGTDIPKLHGGAIKSVPVRYVESKKLKTRKLERGDIVIEVSGGSKDQPTGRSLFISDNILTRLELPSEPASFCRRFKPKSYEIGLLLAVHFQLMYQAGKTWEYQNQSTGISNFQTKYFLEAEHIVIPSDDVLDAFVKQVSLMMDMIHSNQNIELAKLRDTLLPKLLSGEITLD